MNESYFNNKINTSRVREQKPIIYTGNKLL